MEPAPLVEPAPMTPRQMSRCRNRGWTKAWNHTQDPIPVPESPHPYVELVFVEVIVVEVAVVGLGLGTLIPSH